MTVSGAEGTNGLISARHEDDRAQVALELRNVTKSFFGTTVLHGIDLDVQRGEIHGLVGPNGSGKSTLIKVLAGYHTAEPGSSGAVDGDAFTLGDPTSAFRAGLRFVHQDLGLAPSLGALDNLALGRGYHRGRFGSISWRRERVVARQALDALGYNFDPTVPVSHLSAAERTGIAIARALADWQGEAKIPVLDEPTATLPVAEASRLFEVVRRVQRRGVSVLFVSHRFGEVFDICDRVTVLRDGRRIATRGLTGLTREELVELTVGRELSEQGPEQPSGEQAGADQALVVRALGGVTANGVSLEVRRGEIVGVAGVTGSGREELARLVFGAVTRKTGEVLVNGRRLRAVPSASIASGVALVPSERLANAALLSMTVRENITIASMSAFSSAAGIRKSAERDEAMRWIKDLGVVPPDPDAIFSTLSGGNQQKVVIARSLRLNPKVLILNDPTQGDDHCGAWVGGPRGELIGVGGQGWKPFAAGSRLPLVRARAS